MDAGGLQVGSDISAWQTALQSLPPEFKSTPEPIHPLATALVHQPTLRQVEWNPYRHQGSFVPRTAHDFASIMIFVCGQINPNPCRNCLLKNGPFARCIVSPPEVLANSAIKHACASCTYQNQYKKCTNDPITEEEMQKSMIAKGNGRIRSRSFQPRLPKIQSGPKSQKKDKLHQQLRQYQHEARKLTPHPPPPPPPQHTTADTFADKLRQVRSWSPRSRRWMKAEALQWQAAIATVEAERVRIPQNAQSSGQPLTAHTPQAAKQTANSTPNSQPVAPSARFMPIHVMDQGDHGMQDDDEDNDTDMSEDD
ncbi:hypothetical protein BKA67DRAFT_294559 [Truncatella angustata]|uniref:Uncharacterized protein n=1 Tax=Truncatella angustata TaxID=152316 RepID=A0A9P8ZW21_9PEZI|nr:uncharacterized protein BKA67DRAFT_294559 [Truncatella angustata]KAH6652591.1 hypothetical protein BKA67DRAFT_294559 [Truncatella angustata]